MKIDREILVSQSPWEIRCVVVEDGEVVEYHFEDFEDKCPVGMICAGVVEDVVPSLQCAFVRLPDGRKGYLFVTEVSASGVRTIEEYLKPSQRIVVQVLREEENEKRAKLTMKVRIPGVFVIGLPFSKGIKFSRRIKNIEKLKGVADDIRKVSGMGFVVRTAAEVADAKAVREEAEEIAELWRNIKEDKDIRIYYKEPPLHIKVLRDYLGRGVRRVIVDAESLQEEVEKFLERYPVKPEPRVFFMKNESLFERYEVFKVLRSLHLSSVQLPGGGFIVIDEVEGFTGIDVNTGGFSITGKFEDNAYLVNRLAVKEIVRQIRLRNIGGIIIVDFIDMRESKKREEIIKFLKAEFEKDRAVVSIPERMNRFGILVFTREKEGASLTKKREIACPCCGRGRILSPECMLKEKLEEVLRKSPYPSSCMRVRISEKASQYAESLKKIIERFERVTGIKVKLLFAPDVPLEKCYIEWQV